MFFYFVLLLRPSALFIIWIIVLKTWISFVNCMIFFEILSFPFSASQIENKSASHGNKLVLTSGLGRQHCPVAVWNDTGASLSVNAEHDLASGSLFSKTFRRFTRNFFEQLAEIMRFFISNFEGDFSNFYIRCF